MIWACEYESKGGTVGLILFSAKDLNDAQSYLFELVAYHGHTRVFNLNQLASGGIDEVYRLYPRERYPYERT